MRYFSIFILLLAIWQAGNVLFSVLAHQQADEARAQGLDVLGLHEQLRLANRFEPIHPRTLLLLSRTTNDPQLAVSYLRQLTQRQPQNAEYWVALLRAKAKVSEFDSEAALAMKSVSRLGPFEPGLQLSLLRFGGRHWLSLSYELRQLTIDAAERALSTKAPYLERELRTVLLERGLMPFVCSRNPSFTECEASQASFSLKQVTRT